MAINDVSLTSGMRSNLLQLQNTSKLIDRTQERLSTGKQVNSALDNPTNYFAAAAHMNRANDFGIRKDGMAEAIQQIKAADTGITAITALVNSAKGLAQAALGTTSTTERSAFSVQYDTIRTQIDKLASDSGYRGTDLLIKDGSNNTTLNVKFNEDGSSSLVVTGFAADSTGLNMVASTNSWNSASDINNASSILDSAISTLRKESKNLSSNMSIITTRQDFTNTMINTLNTGADNLTLADMSQEGANMLMLQTKQSLGTTALSMSSQAAQSVLRLF